MRTYIFVLAKCQDVRLRVEATSVENAWALLAKKLDRLYVDGVALPLSLNWNMIV